MPEMNIAGILHETRQSAEKAGFSHHLCDHLDTLVASISPECPVSIGSDIGSANDWCRRPGSRVILVVGIDVPGLLSVVTGLLASSGFDVGAAKILTVPYGKDRLAVDGFWGRFGDGGFPAFLLREWQKWLQAHYSMLMSTSGDDRQQVRKIINEKVITAIPMPAATVVPSAVSVRQRSYRGRYRLTISGADAPLFLFSLVNAISLLPISIEQMVVKTTAGNVVDTIDWMPISAGTEAGDRLISHIKLSAFLSKNFTYFLPYSPDPFMALNRFDQWMLEISELRDAKSWIQRVAHPEFFTDIAKILGASDRIWEDVIRYRAACFLPLFETILTLTDIAVWDWAQLNTALSVLSFDDAIRELNEFKDTELAKLDILQLVGRLDFNTFSAALTALADGILCAAMAVAYRLTASELGGFGAIPYAIFGLGKLGAIALGFASDIEVMVVVESDLRTTESVLASEFFDSMMQRFIGLIRTKSDGIFQLDLRLRPYGMAGPLATSISVWCQYYAWDGAGLDYERLALSQLRFIGGSAGIGDQVIGFRDQLLYGERALDAMAIFDIRHRQFRTHQQPNAKHGSGALIDLELAVRLVQIRLGCENPELRSSHFMDTLNGLLTRLDGMGEIDHAYGFFRQVINGLRMRRGSAKDVVLTVSADAIQPVARAMGYGGVNGYQLMMNDYYYFCGRVRLFLVQQFGVESVCDWSEATLWDVVSDEIPGSVCDHILAKMGVSNTKWAKSVIRSITQRWGDHRVWVMVSRHLVVTVNRPRILIELDHVIPCMPTNWADELANSWELVEMLFKIWDISPYLADVFRRWPDTRIGMTAMITRSELENETRSRMDGARSIDVLRKFRHQWTLKIAVWDFVKSIPLSETTRWLSQLAKSSVRIALNWAIADGVGSNALSWDDGIVLSQKICIMAFGKCGAGELNYSSDLDLMVVVDDDSGAILSDIHAVVRRMIAYLSDPNPGGIGYRIDFRLRPYGDQGELVAALSQVTAYYCGHAKLWELQAGLKLWPIAGNFAIGFSVLHTVRQLQRQPRSSKWVWDTIDNLRNKTISRIPPSVWDIKNGRGQIRDIEFGVQGIQLVVASQYPAVLGGNMWRVMAAIVDCGLVSDETAKRVMMIYEYFREIEHRLQIMADQQVSVLPPDLDVIAVQMGDGSGDKLRDRIRSYAEEIMAWRASVISRHHGQIAQAYTTANNETYHRH